MSILIVSPDADATRSLASALGRRGHEGIWLDGASAVRGASKHSPLVLVVDHAAPQFRKVIDDVSTAAPWARIYEIADSPGGNQTGPCFSKPFDAAELAGILALEEELAELDLRRLDLERALEHEKRLAAIGRSTAAMAHEVANALAVIRAANGSVAELARSSQDSALVEAVEDVRLAVNRIESFVNDVSGFARRGRHTLQDASLLETVRTALRLARPHLSGRNVEVELEPGEDPWVPHDEARVTQAVLNILLNAIDAAAEGQGNLTVRVVVDASSARVQVDDDGPGISDEIRDHLFEPFATTKRPGKGTGLGLVITRQIVDDHGGAVTLAPRPNGPGTRAEILLPLVSHGLRSRPSSRPPKRRE